MRETRKVYPHDEDIDLSIEGYTPNYAPDDDSRYQPAAEDIPEPQTPTRTAPARPSVSTRPAVSTRRPAADTRAERTETMSRSRQSDTPASASAAPERQTAPRETKQTKTAASATQTKKADAAEPQERQPMFLVRFFTDYRTRLFLGITLALLSLFVVIALFSHFHVGGKDQSVVSSLTVEQIASKQGIIDNTAGGFGAWLSKAMLCDTLGLGSVVLIVYMWILILALTGARKCNFWGSTFRSLLVAITISTVLGLITYNASTEVYWGGIHGHYVNKYLIENATMIGAILVSVFLVSAVCCVYLNELKRLYRSGQDIMDKRRAESLARREAREAAKAEEDETPAVSPAQSGTPTPATTAASAPSSPTTASGGNSRVASSAAEIASSSKTSSQTPVSQSANTVPTTHDDNDIVIDPNETVMLIDGQKQETNTDDPDFSIISNQIEEGDASQAPRGSLDTPYDHRADLSRYVFPDIDLLEDRPSGPNIDLDEQQANKERIKQTLLDYKIPISRIEATVGPTVTLYEIVPAEGVRISQIKRLEDDIALSLSALGIRIIAPIPGKGTVGIEVPNNDPQTVSMRSVLGSRKYQECKMALPMAMGATISNDIFIADLAKMPHLLVAGATGMGKSVGLNAIIASLLYKKHPTELKFVLIDPKMVEFSLYSKLERHYLAKLENEEDAIITDMKKVVETLNSLCIEMDNRYELLRNANVRSLEEYNRKFTDRRLNPEKGHKYLPYIVVVVDEFADLLMTQGKEVETPIARIAQKARAVGIHMILATQRPSTNVITGLIKANFPGRIAFRVIQMVDSRTILDCPGANQLIGRGDMLFSHNGSMERVQCAFISTEEVERLTEFIDNQYGFPHAYYLPEYVPEEVEGGACGAGTIDKDALFEEAARFVVTRSMGSTSSLQRQFGVGYNRAGKLMDQLEAAGIVGPVNGSKPRNILVDLITLEKILEQA